MISFRYHVISLAAVFLALVVGIVAGSTVVRGPLVDSLRTNVRSAERNLQAVSDESKRLSGDVGRYQEIDRALTRGGAPDVTPTLLEETDVVLVAAGGVDGDDLRTLRDALQKAGARIVEDVRLDQSLALADANSTAHMADTLGVTSTDATELRSMVVEELATALVPLAVDDRGVLSSEASTDASPATTKAPDPVETTSTIPVARAMVELRQGLDGLAEAGFAKIENRISAPTRPYVRLVFVGASGAAPAGDDLVYPLLERLARVPPFIVAVETKPVSNDVGRGEFMRGLRNDERLRGVVTTIDDGDMWAGRMAMVLALRALNDGKVGRYGVGEGADSVLPPPAS